MTGRSRAAIEIERHRVAVRSGVARTVLNGRLDIGATQAAIADAAGISRAYLCEIEAGRAEPSLDVLSAIAVVLGRRLSIGLPPETDPLVRDGRQAPIVESLVRSCTSAGHHRWKCRCSARARRHRRGPGGAAAGAHRVRRGRVADPPARGHHSLGSTKAHALLVSGPVRSDWPTPPSVSPGSGASLDGGQPGDRAGTYRQSVRAGFFPADTHDIYLALTTADAPWPGSGLLWFRVEGTKAHVLP